MDREEVELRPIAHEDAVAVSSFLHEQLNTRVAPEAWAALLSPPWGFEGPNRGFQLTAGSTIVGAYVAVYSEREIDGENRRFCNLAAFCVREQYRAHSVRLMRAILAQKGFEFTDFSPSGNVVALNERLGFVAIDTTTQLTLNLPWSLSRGLKVTNDPAVVAGVLSGRDALIYRDHRLAPAARHVVAISGDEYCYLIFRKDRRKRLPFFTTPLYAGGSRELLQSAWPQLASHFLLRHGAFATLAEKRVLGFVPPRGFTLRAPRAKMFRSSSLSAEEVDYVYSELTLLEW